MKHWANRGGAFAFDYIPHIVKAAEILQGPKRWSLVGANGALQIPGDLRSPFISHFDETLGERGVFRKVNSTRLDSIQFYLN